MKSLFPDGPRRRSVDSGPSIPLRVRSWLAMIEQWRSRSYWSMSKGARKARRARIRHRYTKTVVTGEAAVRAQEILKRRHPGQ